MELFNKLRIKTKILAGFFIVIIMFVGVVGYTYINNQQISRASVFLEKKDYPTLKLASQLLERFKLIGYNFTAATAFADKDSLLKSEKFFKEGKAIFKELKLNNRDDVQELKELETEYENYFERGYKISEAIIKGEDTDFTELKKIGESNKILKNRLKQYLERKENLFSESTREITEKVKAVTLVMIIITLILLLISLLIGIMLATRISQSIERVVYMLKEIAKGNLSGEKVKEKSEDEVGELARTINQMQEELNKMITAVATSSKQVSSSAQKYYHVSKNMLEGVEKQTNQATRVATAAEEMNATINEVTKTLHSATEAAQNTAKRAEDGGIVVNKAIEGMQKISGSVRESGKIIQQLGKSSSQIGEIVSVIEDIADQTNLLALNAAIEAARAGEQGRGFAVVADEVRKLAERTTEATKEISDMIKQIQQDTASAVSSMDTGIKQVEKGVNLANQAGESLDKILRMVKETLGQVEQISASSEEQSSTTEEISKNIALVATISKETADGATQSFQISEKLQEMALDLQDTIAHFKLARD